MNSLYLLINFFTILVPFLFSFHPKIQFYKAWKAFFPAVLITGLLFIVWDVLFTKWGVWGFNERYVTGIYLFRLPLEEILFFFCIPYACVFTYFCLNKFYNLNWNARTESIVILILSAFLLIIGVIFLDRIYTSVTFISTALIILVIKFIAKKSWLGKAITVYGVLLIPFFIVNGILTGTGIEDQVVWYDNRENLGIRLFTIPIEDMIYGFELFILNLTFYAKASKVEV